MLKPSTSLLVLTILFSCTAVAQHPAAASSKGWTKLLQGNSLDGWEVVPIGAGGGKWTVEDGELKVTRLLPDRGAAWLVSRKDYEDFILRVKFRPNSTDYVTGLLIRDPGHAKIGRPAFNAYEVVMQRNPSDINVDGAIYHVANAYDSAVQPDHWVEMEVRCVGDHMVVLLDHKKMSEAHTRRSYKGAIGFHLHGGDTNVNYEFKDIEIQELPPAPHPYQLMEERLLTDLHEVAPLFQSLEDLTGNVGNAWSLNKDVLHGAGSQEDSVLLTKQSFGNFLLDFQFKISVGGNAGVLFRVPADGQAEKSYEFHIEDPYKDNPIGSLFNLARAFPVDGNNQPITKSGTWIRGRVFATGDHLVTYINSEKGVDIHADRSFQGRIGFRVAKGATIDFRNVTIKRVDEKPAAKKAPVSSKKPT